MCRRLSSWTSRGTSGGWGRSTSPAWDSGIAYAELKAGPGTDDIGHCAWDALKCAVARGHAASTYLVAAAPARLWTPTTLGCELFDDRTWDALELRDRYRSWLEYYERKDAQMPLSVTARLRTVALARFYLTVAAECWILGVTRVEPVGTEWMHWPPFHPDLWMSPRAHALLETSGRRRSCRSGVDAFQDEECPACDAGLRW